jgi:hypothetical protein
MTSAGVEIEVVWCDDHVLRLEVSASNGVFAGRIEAYGARDIAAQWAAALEGFPRDRDDCREVSTGTFSDEYAGGGAGLRFVVRAASGHSAVLVRLRASDMVRPIASAEFTIGVEAAAVDRFVAELRAMSTEIGQSAVLVGYC